MGTPFGLQKFYPKTILCVGPNRGPYIYIFSFCPSKSVFGKQYITSRALSFFNYLLTSFGRTPKSLPVSFCAFMSRNKFPIYVFSTCVFNCRCTLAYVIWIIFVCICHMVLWGEGNKKVLFFKVNYLFWVLELTVNCMSADSGVVSGNHMAKFDCSKQWDNSKQEETT